MSVYLQKMDHNVIPRSKKAGLKPLYVCLGCSNHTYSDNMIIDAMFDKNTINISYITTHGS
jgi:hypothetical protein